jgi:Na+(H+)/acetate symporter ActP
MTRQEKDKHLALLPMTLPSSNIKDNIASILLYAFSLATALGFNGLILTIFDSFKWTAHIIAKTTYVVIMFSVTIGLAYYLNSTIR